MKFVLKNYFETSCKILFCTVLFWHAYMQVSEASGLYNERLYELIISTPEAVEAKQNLMLNDFEIDLLTKQTGPKVNFSSNGNYPLKTEISPQNSRVSSVDERYIDGKLSLDVQIYDFGAQNELITSENFKKLSGQIELRILEQELYFDLLKTGFEIVALTQNINMIEGDIELHNLDRAIIKKRFIHGTGTSIDIKEAELISLNLENEYRNAKSDLTERRTYFLVKFGQNFDIYRMEIEEIHKLLPEPVKAFEIENGLKIRKLSYEIEAIESEINSIKKSRLPVISSSLSLNMYNLDVGIGNDYSFTGGVNMKVPLYDTGASKSKEYSALMKIKIVKTQIIKEQNIWQQKWDQNNFAISNITNQIDFISKKQSELSDKYELLQNLSKTLQTNFMETVNARVASRQLYREENQLQWELSGRYLETAYLREYLLMND